MLGGWLRLFPTRPAAKGSVASHSSPTRIQGQHNLCVTDALRMPGVLQAHAPAQQEYSAHAQAVVTRANNAKEGSKSRDSSRGKEAATAAEGSREAVHPTRSRRLSHIYTGEVGAASWSPATSSDQKTPAQGTERLSRRTLTITHPHCCLLSLTAAASGAAAGRG